MIGRVGDVHVLESLPYVSPPYVCSCCWCAMLAQVYHLHIFHDGHDHCQTLLSNS